MPLLPKLILITSKIPLSPDQTAASAVVLADSSMMATQCQSADTSWCKGPYDMASQCKNDWEIHGLLG